MLLGINTKTVHEHEIKSYFFFDGIEQVDPDSDPELENLQDMEWINNVSLDDPIGIEDTSRLSSSNPTRLQLYRNDKEFIVGESGSINPQGFTPLASGGIAFFTWTDELKTQQLKQLQLVIKPTTQ